MVTKVPVEIKFHRKQEGTMLMTTYITLRKCSGCQSCSYKTAKTCSFCGATFVGEDDGRMEGWK